LSTKPSSAQSTRHRLPRRAERRYDESKKAAGNALGNDR
jgi:hypothetical protein